MKQVFEKYLGSDALLEVYPRNSEKFYVGRVLGMDGEFVLMHILSKYGRDEGFVLFLLEDITSVQADTIYLQKTLCLSGRWSARRDLPSVAGGNLLEFLLNYAREKGLGVSVELRDEEPEDYLGVVEACADGILTLRQVGLYGEDDGVAYVRMDEIGRVDCDDQDINARIYFAAHK